MKANNIFNQIIEIENEIISRISTDKNYRTSNSYNEKIKEISNLEKKSLKIKS